MNENLTEIKIKEFDLVKPPPKIDANAKLSIEFEIKDLSSGGSRLKRVWLVYVITYKSNGRNDKFQQTVEARAVTGNQTVNHIAPQTRGGTINATLYVRTGSGTRDFKAPTRVISADSPTNQSVRDYIADKYLETVIYIKSKFKQFNDRQPVFDNGIGLYRIASPTPEQVWSWKKNIDFAKTDFQTRKDTAALIPAEYRRREPDTYRDLPEFNDEQLAIETLQSYGVGNYFIPERGGQFWRWVPTEENDGFAARCLELYKNVQDGNAPHDWD